MSDTILAGFGRVDVTPQTDVPLRGVGNCHMRMPNVLIDPLYTTCIAFTDEEGNSALIYNTDHCVPHLPVTEALRALVKEAYGIPAENVVINSTHTHSGPDVTQTPEYNEWYIQRLYEAAQIAMEDRKPGTMEIGRVQAGHSMNFVRHYILDENGKSCGHKAEPDRQIQVVKITREGGKDIMLMNWQSHPCFGMGIDKKGISADYIGAIRRYVERKSDMHFAFFQGAAGNIASNSRVKGESLTKDQELYGSVLGERALFALTDTQSLAGGPVRGSVRTVTLTVDHSDDHRVADARIITKFWAETNDRKGADALGKPYDIHSPYHAGAIIGRSEAPATKEMTIGAVRVGQLSFAWSPYEMFCENGMYIKENSPYEATFILELSNSRYSYLASAKAYDYGCYEYDVREFVRGTAEYLAENFVEILKELK